MIPALRVLIVSDNLLSRAGLSAILDTHDSLLIVGQTTTESLSDDIGIYQADIVLIDLGWQVSDRKP